MVKLVGLLGKGGEKVDQGKLQAKLHVIESGCAGMAGIPQKDKGGKDFLGSEYQP